MLAPAAVLPDELWAKIFVQLESGVRDGSYFEECMAKAQSQSQQLRSVCRKFNDVVKDHPRLSRCLMLSPALKQKSLPSLLAWLQQHAASVQTLAAYCGRPCLEAALTKLLPPQTLLDNMFLSRCSSLVVPLLSGLTSMTDCHVSKPRGSIDLSPLEKLAKLQKLHLSHGDFYAARLPAHLTVEVADLVMQPSPLGCSCVTSLQKLRVHDGYLMGLHPRGLLACSALEQLQLVKCGIDADEVECWVSYVCKPACLPTGISALTLLSSLTVTWGTGTSLDLLGKHMIDLGLLHAPPLLQDLSVRTEGFSVDLWLSAELGALQNLTSLTLSAPAWNEHARIDHNYFPVVILEVEWGGMHALQLLNVHNWHFSCSSSILALTTLPHLSEVTFQNCRPVGVISEESGLGFFSHSMQHIVRHCPHVKLICDEELVA